MNNNANAGWRPLIALISNQYIDFQKDIAAKLNRALTDAGYGLICVSAGALEPAPGTNTANLAARNAFYKITQQYDVAGFIVLTATIGNHAKANQVIKFVKQYSHKPVVSFGIDVPGTASVTIDNQQSMSMLMEHMTEDPKRKRFAFIRGYANIPDSVQREQAFKKVLTRKGIPIDESLIIDGNFMTADSYFAIEKLLQTKRDIDAVVAASDRMALSAVHALLHHGLRVPEDVIVSGFDDGRSSNGSLPPLTTVAYSMTERVNIATQSLLRQIESGIYEEPDRGPLHCSTKLIIRDSSSVSPRKMISESRDGGVLFDAQDFRRSILDDLSLLKAPANINANDVVDDILSMLVNGDTESGERLATDLLSLRKNPGDIYWWRHLHYQIGTKIQRYGTVGQSEQSMTLIAKVLSQIHKTLWNMEEALQVEDARFQEVQFRLRLNLFACTSLQQLNDTLTYTANRYPGLIAFLCLYDSPGEEPDCKATVAHQYPEDVLDFPADQSFPSQDILPLNFLNSVHNDPFAVEPLCTGSIQFGYLVINLSNQDFLEKANLTALADNISSALWRILK